MKLIDFFTDSDAALGAPEPPFSPFSTASSIPGLHAAIQESPAYDDQWERAEGIESGQNKQQVEHCETSDAKEGDKVNFDEEESRLNGSGILDADLNSNREMNDNLQTGDDAVNPPPEAPSEVNIDGAKDKEEEKNISWNDTARG